MNKFVLFHDYNNFETWNMLFPSIMTQQKCHAEYKNIRTHYLFFMSCMHVHANTGICLYIIMHLN